MSEEQIQFSREIVVAQLAARAELRRALAVVGIVLAVYVTVALFVLPQLKLSDEQWLLAILGPPLVTLFALWQIQWRVLASHQLRCPSCRHLLAADRRWWRSPKPFCKACGKLALLPIWALKRAAAT